MYLGNSEVFCGCRCVFFQLNDLKDLLSGKTKRPPPATGQSLSIGGRGVGGGAGGRGVGGGAGGSGSGRSATTTLSSVPASSLASIPSGIITSKPLDTTSSILATLESYNGTSASASKTLSVSAFERDPLDSLSELNRLLRVKATLRRASTVGTDGSQAVGSGIVTVAAVTGSSFPFAPGNVSFHTSVGSSNSNSNSNSTSRTSRHF